jgi:hypothetical protein
LEKSNTKKRTFLFLLILTAFYFSFSALTVYGFNTLSSRYYDDFNRDSLGVTEPGNTGSGTEPDETWVHNPDNFVVYWIQYNTATLATIEDGVLKFETTGEDGWLGFGMTGDFKDKNYDSFSVKLKGEKGGEEAGLYFNINGAYEFKWDNARDPDGNTLPPITTEWQTFNVSLANSGMGATKAQRNIMAGGWTDFHINSFGGPLTVYIDEIKQIQTREYTEPVAPAATVNETENAVSEDVAGNSASADSTGSETESASAGGSDGGETAEAGSESDAVTEPETGGEPAEAQNSPDGTEQPQEVIYPETDRPLTNSFLVDDFNRASLLMDPELEIAPGGAFGLPNTDGNPVYWISFNDVTTPVIENGILKLTATGAGWYGTATDSAFLDEYNCVAFRIKGERGGEEALLTFNPDTLGSKAFADLIAPDGSKVAPITTEWQTIVVDLKKSGWKGLADGKEFYQNIHLNTDGELTVYIDEIYFTAVNLEIPPPEDLAEDAPEDVTQPDDSQPEQTQEVTSQQAQNEVETPEEETKGMPRTVILIIVLAVIVCSAVVGIVIFVMRKPH